MRSGFFALLFLTALIVSGCGGAGVTTSPPVAPTVTSVMPASGATGVSVSTAIYGSFSEAMNASTIGASSFTLSGPSGAVAGTVSYSSTSNSATFTPSANLAFNTQYTATITTAAMDSDGAALAANYAWSFTTAQAPAPTVTEVTPATGVIAVPIATALTATFSEPMNSSSLGASTFTLASGGASVAGTVTYSTTGNVATFTPSAPLANGTQYTATITTGVTSSNGAALAANYAWSFTTVAAPPAVTEVSPANNATNVAARSIVTATFSQVMNSSSVIGAFTLTTAGGSSVSGNVTYNTSNSIATFTPSADLAYDTAYTATISTAATSSAGIPLSQSYAWTFTTAAAVPTVLSTVPASGATGVSVTQALTANFSTAMSSTTISTSTFTLTGPSGAVSGIVSYSAGTDSASFIPSASLAYSTEYTATITTGAQSTADVALASNYQWTFTTGANPSVATVDFSISQQTIRGFGGSTAWLGTLTTQQATALFNPTNGLGLSILRVRIDPEGSASGGGAYGYKYETGEWDAELANAQEAQSANPNAIVFATPWTPPAVWKLAGGIVTNDGVTVNQAFASSCGSEGTDYCGGYLDPNHYGDYANYLEGFISFMASADAPPVNLYAISMQNEPEENVTYESCVWTPQEMDNFVESLTSSDPNPLTTKLMMPESAVFNFDFSNPTLDDTSAEPNVSIIGGHLYSSGESVNDPQPYALAEGFGKDVWATEHYLCPVSGGCNGSAQPTIADALNAAEEVHNTLVVAGYNAYVWWWIWDDECDGVNYGLMNDGGGESGSGCYTSAQPSPTYYGYAIGQFAKFIQPGYVRYEAPANPQSGVYLSAYSGTQSGVTHYVLVVINANTAAVTESFILQNGNITSLTPYQTTSAGGLMAEPGVAVSGGQFTYTLPAQSITTLVQ